MNTLRVSRIVLSALLALLLSGCGGESTSSSGAGAVSTVTVVTAPGSGSSPTTPTSPQPIDPGTVVRSGLKAPEEDAPMGPASLVTETDEAGTSLRSRLWLKKRGR